MNASTANPPYRNDTGVTLRRCDQCRKRYPFTRSTSRFCSPRCRVAAARKRAKRSVHFRSDTDNWATPPELFAELHREFGFGLDVCASADNSKCHRFYSAADDGLRQPWEGVCWMNPPYGRQIGRWVAKARESASSGATVVCLVPARTDTAWWHDHVAGHAEVRFLRGRVRFGEAKSGAPFPSAVCIFRPPRSSDAC